MVGKGEVGRGGGLWDGKYFWQGRARYTHLLPSKLSLPFTATNPTCSRSWRTLRGTLPPPPTTHLQDVHEDVGRVQLANAEAAPYPSLRVHLESIIMASCTNIGCNIQHKKLCIATPLWRQPLKWNTALSRQKSLDRVLTDFEPCMQQTGLLSQPSLRNAEQHVVIINSNSTTEPQYN